MFAAFNLITDEEDYLIKNYYDSGKKMYGNLKKTVQDQLDKYVGENGSLDGTKIQGDWFPEIKADIFISHSHKDEKLAISLAGLFYNWFGLNTFIDSCVWGYSNDLLKKLDDIYSLLPEDSSAKYDYDKRNYSTSHVHMMLSTALTKMIDKTECVFVLNTPNSISTKDALTKTDSPWIYAETVSTELLRKKELREYRKSLKKALKETKAFVDKTLNIKYDVNLSHLYALNDQDLVNWYKIFSKDTQNLESPLDHLYILLNIPMI